MPYTPDAPLEPHQIPTFPGTNQVISRSFDDRLLVAEFDDALVDQTHWKNPRYEGSKLKGKKINEYNAPEIKEASIGTAAIGQSFIVGDYPEVVVGWEGDKTFGLNPVINNESIALYIANTVIGGTEDEQFATLRNHSYVGINKILLVNPNTDEVQIIDRVAEPFEVFHRFLTTDFPTGIKCGLKIIDESISTNLRDTYRVKMNKGYLLKTLDFQFAGEFSGSQADSGSCLIENNSLYVYHTYDSTTGLTEREFSETGNALGTIAVNMTPKTRFMYGVNEMFSATIPLGGGDAQNIERNKVGLGNLGPNYVSSSIIRNKFTEQYYTGSFGLFNHNFYQGALPSGSGGLNSTDSDGIPIVGGPTPSQITQGDVVASTAFGSASRFIGVDTLQFLANNNDDTSLDEQDKTELHVTFFEGTKDFSSGSFDERSISTFEVDRNQSIFQGISGSCNGGLPRRHELVFKGGPDTRFRPLTPTFQDDIRSAFFESSGSGDISGSGEGACVPYDQELISDSNSLGSGDRLQMGTSIDLISNASIFVQGGALGPIGYSGAQLTGSSGYYNPLNSSMKIDNYYSGSFSYQLSFLDKDHTLILDLDKESELFDGIGEKGLVLIPDTLNPKVKDNIEYYLEKAGIKEKTTTTKQKLNYTTKR